MKIKTRKTIENTKETTSWRLERWTFPLSLSTGRNVRREQWRRTPKAFLTPRPPSLLFPPEWHSFPSKQETRPGLTSQRLVAPLPGAPLPATSTVSSFRLSLLAPPAQNHLRSPLSHHDWLALFTSRWNAYLFCSFSPLCSLLLINRELSETTNTLQVKVAAAHLARRLPACLALSCGSSCWSCSAQAPPLISREFTVTRT